jgi:magnesium transporter
MSNPSDKTGLPPGTILYTGIERECEISIQGINFNESEIYQFGNEIFDNHLKSQEENSIRWIHAYGVHDTKIIENLGKIYGIHPLLLEDIVNVYQRPKIDVMDEIVFIVLRDFNFQTSQVDLDSEQLSFILGQNYVLSFQETANDLFAAVRKRIYQSKGRIRKSGADYLLYSLIDLIIDRYFLVLEEISNRIEILEDELISATTTETLQRIYELKRIMSTLRRYMWPLREAVFKLSRENVELFQDSTLLYLRDLYDHVIQVSDQVETYRESISAMVDIYLSSLSNKMNEVMKVLTVISTIFIPATLLASIYGMNFIYMPELVWEYSYPILLMFMVLLGVFLLALFRRKGWV